MYIKDLLIDHVLKIYHTFCPLNEFKYSLSYNLKVNLF